MVQQQAVHDTPEKRLTRLASMPGIYYVVQTFIEGHVPTVNDGGWVIVDPDIMTPLCLVALVGLDAIDAERQRRGL